MNRYIKAKFGRKIVIAVLLSIGMSILRLIPSLVAGYNVREYFFSILMGYSKHDANLLEFLYAVFYYVVPLYIIDIFLEQEIQNENQTAKIRCQNSLVWTNAVKHMCYIFSIQYIIIDLLVQGIFLFISCIILGKNEGIFLTQFLAFYGMDKMDFISATIVAIFARSIELMFLVMINYILVEKSGNTIFAFLMSLLGYFVTMFFEFSKVEYLIPFGNAGLYTIFESVQSEGWKYALIKLFGLYIVWGVCVAGLYKIKWRNSSGYSYRIKKYK